MTPRSSAGDNNVDPRDLPWLSDVDWFEARPVKRGGGHHGWRGECLDPSGRARTVIAPVAVLRDAGAPETAAQGASPNGHRATRASKPSAIPVLDLFAGAGGLSLGLRQAGFVPVGAVENMTDAAKTYSEAHGVDVMRVRVSEANLAAFRGKVQVVVGGPPCQPWSTGGLRRGERDGRDGFPVCSPFATSESRYGLTFAAGPGTGPNAPAAIGSSVSLRRRTIA
jgi:hypothetical protein